MPGDSPVDQYQITITGSDGAGTLTQTVDGTTLTAYFAVDYNPELDGDRAGAQRRRVRPVTHTGQAGRLVAESWKAKKIFAGDQASAR